MGDAAGGVVSHGAAEVFLGDVFVGDGLDDVRPGDEHAGNVAGHENEIGDGGRIDGAAGAGTEDGADLRDDAACEGIAEKNFRVAGEGGDAFLNARAAGIVESDHRSADAHGVIHDFADLHGIRFGERTAEDGKVLGENENESAIHAAVAGDKPVADDALLRHAEIGAAMGHVLIEFFECAFVAEQFDAFASGELAFLVLALAALGAAAGFSECVALLEFFEALLGVHGRVLWALR